jgi:hypothetical protein
MAVDGPVGGRSGLVPEPAEPNQQILVRNVSFGWYACSDSVKANSCHGLRATRISLSYSRRWARWYWPRSCLMVTGPRAKVWCSSRRRPMPRLLARSLRVTCTVVDRLVSPPRYVRRVFDVEYTQTYSSTRAGTSSRVPPLSRLLLYDHVNLRKRDDRGGVRRKEPWITVLVEDLNSVGCSSSHSCDRCT